MNKDQILVFFNKVKGKKIRFTGWDSFSKKGSYLIPDKLIGRNMSGIYYNNVNIDNFKYISGWTIGNGFEPNHDNCDRHWEFVDEIDKEQEDYCSVNKCAESCDAHKPNQPNQVIALKEHVKVDCLSGEWELTVKGGNIAVKCDIHMADIPEKVRSIDYDRVMMIPSNVVMKRKNAIDILKESAANIQYEEHKKRSDECFGSNEFHGHAIMHDEDNKPKQSKEDARLCAEVAGWTGVFGGTIDKSNPSGSFSNFSIGYTINEKKCQCGKEKHGFAGHMNFCPKVKENWK